MLLRMAQTTLNRTYLAFQHNAKLTTLSATIQSITPATSLSESNRTAFKGMTLTPADHVIITDQTLFHPQGGGQPSDTGTMTLPDSSTPTFNVTAVRMALDPSQPGQVLHLGTFSSSSQFPPQTTITQTLDTAKRQLYSRYHTAGHVLGSAVRHLYGTKIANFDELKANHFPSTASCEFQGLIDGSLKPEIQAKVDAFIAADMSVEIEFWDEADFVREGLQRLIPDREVVGMAADEKFRVVRIRGAEVYPCGGTHVDSTKGCGRTTVRKISRQKGVSRVSYVLEEEG